MRGRRLKSMADLRRYIAGLINRVEMGKMDPGIASRLGYLANILKGIIEGSNLEARVEELEKMLSKEGYK